MNFLGFGRKPRIEPLSPPVTFQEARDALSATVWYKSCNEKDREGLTTVFNTPDFAKNEEEIILKLRLAKGYVIRKRPEYSIPGAPTPIELEAAAQLAAEITFREIQNLVTTARLGTLANSQIAQRPADPAV